LGAPGPDPCGSGAFFTFTRGSNRAALDIAMTWKILIVEDDADTAKYIAQGLVQEGHVVDLVDDGRDGLFQASSGLFDLIILDRMMPGMDGLSLMRALRASGVATPVLILSALGTVDERICGLEAGADDYLVKPFSFAELIARAAALMRRQRNGAELTDTRIVVGDLEIDCLKRLVRRNSRTIELQPREYKLLEFLARNEGRVITRTMLIERVWHYHFDPGTNVVDVHISRLRRKLDAGFDRPLLHTIRGAGYRLSAEA
jgi:two-component system OmpR family response regulator